MSEPFPPLTPTECRVVNRIEQGLSYRRIAFELGITVRTVRAHVSNIADKLPRQDGVPAGRAVFCWAVRRRVDTSAA